MPISRYQIKNEDRLADPALYRAADPDDSEAILEGVAMAGLVGVLRQLGDLAEFAAEIFHGLHEEVIATSARGHTLMLRVQQLEEEFPSPEKAFLSQTSHTHFLQNAGTDWHVQTDVDQNLITRGDLPRFIMDSYEECRSPPRLFLLDRFDVAGTGACLKRYSDPSFFKTEFAASENLKEEIHRVKKSRKIKKKGLRGKNGDDFFSPSALNSKFWEVGAEPDNLHQKFSTNCVKLKRRHLDGLSGNSKTRSYMEQFCEIQSHELQSASESSLTFDFLRRNSVEIASETCKIVTSDSNIQIPQIEQNNETWEPAVKGKLPLKELLNESEPQKRVSFSSDAGPKYTTIDASNSVDCINVSESYVDALTTFESGEETNSKSNAKFEKAFLNNPNQGLNTNPVEKDLDLPDHHSGSYSFEESDSSYDGDYSPGEHEYLRYSFDTHKNKVEVSTSSEICPAELGDSPSEEVSTVETILTNDSRYLSTGGICDNISIVSCISEVVDASSSCSSVTYSNACDLSSGLPGISGIVCRSVDGIPINGMDPCLIVSMRQTEMSTTNISGFNGNKSLPEGNVYDINPDEGVQIKTVKLDTSYLSSMVEYESPDKNDYILCAKNVHTAESLSDYSCNLPTVMSQMENDEGKSSVDQKRYGSTFSECHCVPLYNEQNNMVAGESIAVAVASDVPDEALLSFWDNKLESTESCGESTSQLTYPTVGDAPHTDLVGSVSDLPIALHFLHRHDVSDLTVGGILTQAGVAVEQSSPIAHLKQSACPISECVLVDAGIDDLDLALATGGTTVEAGGIDDLELALETEGTIGEAGGIDDLDPALAIESMIVETGEVVYHTSPTVEQELPLVGVTSASTIGNECDTQTPDWHISLELSHFNQAVHCTSEAAVSQSSFINVQELSASIGGTYRDTAIITNKGQNKISYDTFFHELSDVLMVNNMLSKAEDEKHGLDSTPILKGSFMEAHKQSSSSEARNELSEDDRGFDLVMLETSSINVQEQTAGSVTHAKFVEANHIATQPALAYANEQSGELAGFGEHHSENDQNKHIQGVELANRDESPLHIPVVADDGCLGVSIVQVVRDSDTVVQEECCSKKVPDLHMAVTGEPSSCGTDARLNAPTIQITAVKNQPTHVKDANAIQLLRECDPEVYTSVSDSTSFGGNHGESFLSSESVIIELLNRGNAGTGSQTTISTVKKQMGNSADSRSIQHILVSDAEHDSYHHSSPTESVMFESHSMIDSVIGEFRNNAVMRLNDSRMPDLEGKVFQPFYVSSESTGGQLESLPDDAFHSSNNSNDGLDISVAVSTVDIVGQSGHGGSDPKLNLDCEFNIYSSNGAVTGMNAPLKFPTSENINEPAYDSDAKPAHLGPEYDLEFHNYLSNKADAGLDDHMKPVTVENVDQAACTHSSLECVQSQSDSDVKFHNYSIGQIPVERVQIESCNTNDLTVSISRESNRGHLDAEHSRKYKISKDHQLETGKTVDVGSSHDSAYLAYMDQISVTLLSLESVYNKLECNGSQSAISFVEPANNFIERTYNQNEHAGQDEGQFISLCKGKVPEVLKDDKKMSGLKSPCQNHETEDTTCLPIHFHPESANSSRSALGEEEDEKYSDLQYKREKSVAQSGLYPLVKRQQCDPYIREEDQCGSHLLEGQQKCETDNLEALQPGCSDELEEGQQRGSQILELQLLDTKQIADISSSRKCFLLENDIPSNQTLDEIQSLVQNDLDISFQEECHPQAWAKHQLCGSCTTEQQHFKHVRLSSAVASGSDADPSTVSVELEAYGELSHCFNQEDSVTVRSQSNILSPSVDLYLAGRSQNLSTSAEGLPPFPPLPPLQWRMKRPKQLSNTYVREEAVQFDLLQEFPSAEDNKHPHSVLFPSKGTCLQPTSPLLSSPPLICTDNLIGLHSVFSTPMTFGECFVPHLNPVAALDNKSPESSTSSFQGNVSEPPCSSESHASLERKSKYEPVSEILVETIGPCTNAGLENAEDERLNGKLDHPRGQDPLIKADAAHDRSELKKVCDRAGLEVNEKIEERSSWLEQIRMKSFNLKPAVSMMPVIQGPRTNLKVVAILEKARAIRQALAGSDDDADSWSGSDT